MTKNFPLVDSYKMIEEKLGRIPVIQKKQLRLVFGKDWNAQLSALANRPLKENGKPLNGNYKLNWDTYGSDSSVLGESVDLETPIAAVVDSDV